MSEKPPFPAGTVPFGWLVVGDFFLAVGSDGEPAGYGIMSHNYRCVEVAQAGYRRPGWATTYDEVLGNARVAFNYWEAVFPNRTQTR